MLTSNGIKKQRFLDLFYDPLIDCQPITVKTKLSLYMLRIDGGKFDYEALYTELGNASIGYVLSRSQYNKSTIENQHETVKYVQSRFRETDVNDGEGGELLLYCFLEAHLGAPKILSKMEIKTASNNYINGSDGVHLLEVTPGSYHLIFGESKMISDSTVKGSSFRKGLADAFKSIKTVEDGGIIDEIKLVNSNLMKESFDADTLELIKGILVPSARNTATKKQNAFGIFVGFEIDITDWQLANMTDDEFEIKIKYDVEQAVKEKYDYITEKIQEHGLEGYHFYLYTVPFLKSNHTNIDTARKQIIDKI